MPSTPSTTRFHMSPKERTELEQRKVKYAQGLNLKAIHEIDDRHCYVFNRKGERVILDMFDVHCLLDCDGNAELAWISMCKKLGVRGAR